MKKYLITLITSTLIAINILAITPLFSTGIAYAQKKGGGGGGGSSNEAVDAVCEGIGLTGADCGGSGKSSADKTLNNTIKLVINVLSWIVGVVAVVVIIIAGLMFVTSGGNSENAGKAKNMILYAVIGLIVVAMAQVIVIFVLGEATNIK